MPAVIQIDQPTGAGPGVAGLARDDLWLGRQVELLVATAGVTSVEWVLLDAPEGSAATLANASQAGPPPFLPCTITPDVRGTYRVRQITNGGGPNNVTTKVFRVPYDNTGALNGTGWTYPALGESAEENNTASNPGRSYAKVLADLFEAASASLPPPADPLPTPDTLALRDNSGNLSAVAFSGPPAASTVFYGDVNATLHADSGDATVIADVDVDVQAVTGSVSVTAGQAVDISAVQAVHVSAGATHGLDIHTGGAAATVSPAADTIRLSTEDLVLYALDETGRSDALNRTRPALASSGSVTLTFDHHHVLSGTATISALPLAGADDVGRCIAITNRTAGALTVNRAGGDTIDGSNSFSLAAGAKVVLECVAAGDWAAWG